MATDVQLLKGTITTVEREDEETIHLTYANGRVVTIRGGSCNGRGFLDVELSKNRAKPSEVL